MDLHRTLLYSEFESEVQHHRTEYSCENTFLLISRYNVSIISHCSARVDCFLVFHSWQKTFEETFINLYFLYLCSVLLPFFSLPPHRVLLTSNPVPHLGWQHWTETMLCFVLHVSSFLDLYFKHSAAASTAPLTNSLLYSPANFRSFHYPFFKSVNLSVVVIIMHIKQMGEKTSKWSNTWCLITLIILFSPFFYSVFFKI